MKQRYCFPVLPVTVFTITGLFLRREQALKRTGLLLLLFLTLFSSAQYHPAAGIAGSSAIKYDHSLFIDWASSCTLTRGWINVADTTLGWVTHGTAIDAVGIADLQVVSLGDGGMAEVSFNVPIANGPGWDFAVFENSFSDTYLELAFVEVSSDGTNFFRFPAHSLTQDSLQVGGFGALEPEKINNFAGKYRGEYGVPFDLEEMKHISLLDVNSIIAIRIIDAVGSIMPQYATYDTAGRMVNDPWPTAFSSSGFDLDAVGVINNKTNTSIASSAAIAAALGFFPNPAKESIMIEMPEGGEVVIYTLSGIALKHMYTSGMHDISDIKRGIYFVQFLYKHTVMKTIKLLVIE